MDESVFVHIVTYNNEATIQRTLESVLAQRGVALSVHVCDNASTDRTPSLVAPFVERGVVFSRNGENIGFCGAHNQGVKTFLQGSWQYLLILNPDISLENDCLEQLIRGADTSQRIGMTTPKLFRADETLVPVEPRRLDAAGMVLTAALRHFDRGSDSEDSYFEQEDVFGGTGACLLIERRCVQALLLKGDRYDSLKYAVCAALKEGEEDRAPLFDEAFFAYREDADLCWRSGLLGWRCKYIPQAVGYHKRVVLSSNRSVTSARLNGLGVQNRFLLQINNYFPFRNSFLMFFLGALVRNITVLLGVLFLERTSLRYLHAVITLLPRALERRRILLSRIHGS